MILQYIKAVEDLQYLFQELADSGKIEDGQAHRYDQSQKVLVTFHSWVQNQINGNFKVEMPWDDEQFKKVWKLWVDYKKQQFRFIYEVIGEQGALNDLVDLSSGDREKAIAIIHQSIKKGWKSFYQLTEQKAITKKLVQEQQTDYKRQLMNRLGVE